ncbi:type IV pilus protein [Klebsiella pneumoniae]|nr:type IV pilus protein [Klebsiella pneumoniae]PCO67894.1 type IV pilus protein [Klebsiella variicola]
MKRLVLALLLFIFKELAVVSVLMPEVVHYDSYLLLDT